MKLRLFSLFLFLFIFTVTFHDKVEAASATQSAQTNVQVTVAGYSLSVSGYIAPFASVVLTINNTVITSTTADAQGNFSFSNVTVPKATSTICFDAVDYKKLGQSEACVSVTPINGVITKTGIFLPPTLGVQRTDVQIGDDALAFGYGMPGARITVHLNGNTGCSVIADIGGYYACNIKIQKAGNNELFADSVLAGKPSEQQLKKILIQGISGFKPTAGPTPSGLGQLPGFNLFEIPWWVWLLLVLIVIILIIILLRKYRPTALPGIPVPSIKINHAFDFLFKKRKLHHHWMKGVGY